MSGWRKVRAEDARALRDWLADREDYACGFAWRAFGAPSAVPALRPDAAVYARIEGGAIAGAVLRARGGMVFAHFDRLPDDGTGVPPTPLFGPGSGAISSAMGREADVDRFEAMERLRPALSIRYVTMRLGAAGTAPAAVPPPALRVRRAVPADLRALAPLQAAYEREEVLTAMHVFDARSSEAGLAAALGEQRVWLAEFEGRPVAKAQTNARGVRMEQAGGIFVVPEFRGRGFGRAVVGALVSDIAAAGKGTTLFVKRDNAPARNLYRALGFEELGPFRIDYWNP